ncbi:MAG: NFACT family protein [Clostridia bacterium]|nr:NFACT family protein [Clostridia bacterium]
MPLDAVVIHAIREELQKELIGARIDKVQMPERDVLLLSVRGNAGNRKLLLSANTGSARVQFTENSYENPTEPPMFCMLLRKHLTGAKLSDIIQPDFERAAVLVFDTYDEMGFPCKRKLIAEIMGKYSNLIFTDENDKIIALLKTIDFTTSSLRQLLPGMKYEMPPKQEKSNPLNADFESFRAEYEKQPREKAADKFIISSYLGISSPLSREIVFRATKHTDTPLAFCTAEELWQSFSGVLKVIKEGSYSPCMVLDENGRPVEYSFTELSHYGVPMVLKHFETLREMLDAFYEGRDREQRVRQRAADILHLLTNAESRLIKKISAQEQELADCDKGEEYKKYGDLITANLYMLSRGMKRVRLTDYSVMNDDGSFGVAEIEMDERLSPPANAQRMYKKYNKSKTARVELTKQIAIARSELEYIYTVFDALTKAENASDLSEIRDELYSSG